MKIKIRL